MLFYFTNCYFMICRVSIFPCYHYNCQTEGLLKNEKSSKWNSFFQYFHNTSSVKFLLVCVFPMPFKKNMRRQFCSSIKLHTKTPHLLYIHSWNYNTRNNISLSVGKISFKYLKSDSHLPKYLFCFLQWKPFKNDEK